MQHSWVFPVEPVDVFLRVVAQELTVPVLAHAGPRRLYGAAAPPSGGLFLLLFILFLERSFFSFLNCWVKSRSLPSMRRAQGKSLMFCVLVCLEERKIKGPLWDS